MDGPFTLGDTFSNIVIGKEGYGSGERSAGSGTIAGFVIKLNSKLSGRNFDFDYVIASKDKIDKAYISNIDVARLNVSGGKYKKSRNTRKRTRRQ